MARHYVDYADGCDEQFWLVSRPGYNVDHTCDQCGTTSRMVC